MFNRDTSGSAQGSPPGRSRGLTLIEVMVSISLTTVTIMAALMVRYYAVKQAVRANAYSTAGRIGQMLLEGWRSGEPNLYEPYDRFEDQIPINVAATGPAVASEGFTTYTSPRGNTSYEVVLDHVYYYATLARMPPVTTAGWERPETLHVTVAFRDNYQAGDVSSNANIIRLTTYR